MDHYFDFGDGAAPNTSNEQEAELLEATAFGIDVDQVLGQTALEREGPNPQQYFAASFPHSESELQMSAPWGCGDVEYIPQWLDYTVAPLRPCIACHLQNEVCQIISGPVSQGSLTCILCASQSLQCSLNTDNYTNSVQSISNVLPLGQTLQNRSNFEGALNLEGLYETSSLSSPTWPSGADAPVSHSSGPARSRTKYSRETINILGYWLSTHQSHPYPTEEEKEYLQSQTGLSKVQITNWLANARRRRPSRITEPTRSDDRPLELLEMSMRPGQREIGLMGPMERSLHSNAEGDLVNTNNVASRLYSSQIPNAYPPTDDGSGRSQARASSASSADSEVSFESQQSTYSHRSRASIRLTKRGRRRRHHTLNMPEKDTLGTTRQYQCTFCVETFKTKHDWQRHEKSLHLSLERWICAPNGGVAIKRSLTEPTCVFCDIANPSNAHMESHNYASCLERTQGERTFYRKDHLRQHLRLVHNCKLPEAETDEWKIVIANVRSRCGFCDLEMDSWPQRIDHIAEHFRGGVTMADWKGDKGFEPHIQELVENEIPPGGFASTPSELLAVPKRSRRSSRVELTRV